MDAYVSVLQCEYLGTQNLIKHSLRLFSSRRLTLPNPRHKFASSEWFPKVVIALSGNSLGKGLSIVVNIEILYDNDERSMECINIDWLSEILQNKALRARGPTSKFHLNRFLAHLAQENAFAFWVLSLAVRCTANTPSACISFD